MARIRSIKPDLWTDPAFVSCSPMARLLWIGTWNHADDYGVLKDDPGKLKLQIIPGDPCDPHDLVDELVDADLLQRKVAPDGTAVLVIRTFCVHQKIDRRAVGRYGQPGDFSDHPAPPEPTLVRPIPTDPHHSPPIPPEPPRPQPSATIRTEGNGLEGKGKTLPASSTNGIITPEVVNCPPPAAPGEGTALATLPIDLPEPEAAPTTRAHLVAVPFTPEPANPQPPATRTGPTLARSGRFFEYPPDFEAWWSLYPRKVDKFEAHKAWERARRHASWDDLMGGLRAWAACWQAERRDVKHVPYPEKWLRKRSWQDAPEPTVVLAAQPQPKGYEGIAAFVAGLGPA